METKVKARKWGSSLAVILPKIMVQAKKIHENDELVIEIKKRPLAGELFGKFAQLTNKKTAQELKDEAKKGWD